MKCSDFAALRFSLFRVGIKDFTDYFLQNLRQKSEYFPADSFLNFRLSFSPFLLGKWGEEWVRKKISGDVAFPDFYCTFAPQSRKEHSLVCLLRVGL